MGYDKVDTFVTIPWVKRENFALPGILPRALSQPHPSL